jgi:hypothetical protein
MATLVTPYASLNAVARGTMKQYVSSSTHEDTNAMAQMLGQRNRPRMESGLKM